MKNLIARSALALAALCAWSVAAGAPTAAPVAASAARTHLAQPELPDPTRTTDNDLKDAEKVASKAPRKPGVTRVAILNFGPPSDWQGVVDSMVGTVINAAAWDKAVPMLEKDNVDVVVVRINSGGGMLLELSRFNDVFEKKYKPRFRTVGWVESAISAAAMAPYVLREFYFLPEGNLGACTGWSGDLQAIKDEGLSDVLYYMERMSALAGRDSRIMRAMQIQEPLSADIDENGNVTLHQNTSGKLIINPEKQVLTLNAVQAAQIKFSMGTAATKEELAKAMGLAEVEWAGKEAADFIDKNMRDNDRAAKKFRTIYEKYEMCVKGAASLQDDRRKTEVGVARRHLEELKSIMKLNGNVALIAGASPEWFRKQEELLKDLLRKK